jgi:hypothetical protein
MASAPANQASGWFETAWHYVSIGYGDQQMGLLVGTDDEKEARREAEELCSSFGVERRFSSYERW